MSANTGPFRGKLPQVKSAVGGTSPEIAAGNQSKALQDLQRDVQAGKDASDVGPKGEAFRGGTNDQTVEVKFKKANLPVFISHDFGYNVRNWYVVDIDGPGIIFRPRGKKYTASKKGIWLVCDQDDITARIRIDGQKGAA